MCNIGDGMTEATILAEHGDPMTSLISQEDSLLYSPDNIILTLDVTANQCCRVIEQPHSHTPTEYCVQRASTILNSTDSHDLCGRPLDCYSVLNNGEPTRRILKDHLTAWVFPSARRFSVSREDIPPKVLPVSQVSKYPASTEESDGNTTWVQTNDPFHVCYDRSLLNLNSLQTFNKFRLTSNGLEVCTFLVFLVPYV